MALVKCPNCWGLHVENRPHLCIKRRPPAPVPWLADMGGRCVRCDSWGLGVEGHQVGNPCPWAYGTDAIVRCWSDSLPAGMAVEDLARILESASQELAAQMTGNRRIGVYAFVKLLLGRATAGLTVEVVCLRPGQNHVLVTTAPAGARASWNDEAPMHLALPPLYGSNP